MSQACALPLFSLSLSLPRQAQLAAAAAAEDGTDGAMDIVRAPGTSTTATSTSNGSSGEGGGAEEGDTGEWRNTVATHPFTLLALDIPPMPMFRDSEGGLVIPQVGG
jgi:hypothetical protein